MGSQSDSTPAGLVERLLPLHVTMNVSNGAKRELNILRNAMSSVDM